jgi:tetratricopeptide (TPR) repeat protein
LYIFAPFTDEELESYAQFVESDNAKWMHTVMREGILKGIETLGNDLVHGLAPLGKPAGPFLKDPVEGHTPQDLYAQGVRLIDNGKDREAIRFLDAALQLKPDYAIAYYKRGNAYRNVDLSSKALSDYAQAIKFDPSMTLAYLNRGTAYKYLGQPQRALEDFTLGIQSNPQVAAVWIERAVTYHLLEQYTQAVADYTQAIRLTPTDGEAWAWRGMSHGQLQEWQRSWEDCEIGIRLGTRPSELAPVYACTGRALVPMKDYTRAIAELDRSIELDPRSGVAYQNRGWALEEAGRIDAALRDYDKAIELDPRDAWAHCQRAKVLDRLGRSAENGTDRAYCSADQK